MKVTLTVAIVINNRGEQLAAQKEILVPYPPFVGLPIWDKAWKQSLSVKNVSASNETGTVVADLGRIDCPTEAEAELVKQEYERAGWEVT